jgi:hypothetical protein
MDQTEELEEMVNIIMKPVEEGGCCRTEITAKGAGGEVTCPSTLPPFPLLSLLSLRLPLLLTPLLQVACIDFDLMFGVLLKSYGELLLGERDALVAAAMTNDKDGDGNIEPADFTAFVDVVMGEGHYTHKKTRKMYHHLYSMFVDENNPDDHISYGELSLYCVSHGIYVSPAWKKIATDFL